MPDLTKTPPGAEPCDPGPDTIPLPGSHDCYPDKNGSGNSFYYRHPGLVPAGASPLHGNRDPNVSHGFNYGMVLLPYSIDYGRQPRMMTRRRAYPVIFHAFASHYDRNYALRSITAFVPPNDKYLPKFMLYIIGIKPFAGYRWHVDAARRWLTYADSVANALAGPRSVPTATALGYGASWIEATRPLWETLTIERWPYSSTDFVRYWETDATNAALSAAG